MEPKSPNQFEQGGAPTEFQPSFPSGEVPREQERSGEHQPVSVEQSSQPATAPVPVPTNIPLPQPVSQAPPSPVAVDDGSPAVAGDDDLIEKEWVDKAKKIIATTKDDPYRREREVGKLQTDYLQKRYGKSLGRDE